MDMTESIAPKSDQLDAIDLLSGPRTFTITKVEKNSSPDQPVNVHLAEFPRVWRPGKSMRRVLVAAWGPDATKYVGQSVTLYCDPSVKFGPDTVGGTRISHMTGLDKPLSLPLLIKRGKSAIFTVQPLKTTPAPAEPARDWDALIAGCATEEELRALYGQTTDPAVQKRILAARDGLNLGGEKSTKTPE